MAGELMRFENFKPTGDERKDFETVKAMLAKMQRDIYGKLTEISIGEKSATIGTVGSTALYLRTLTVNDVTITVVTSD